MELHELGKVYLEVSIAITERIHQLRKEVKKLSGSDLIIMNRRILSLYTDAAECRRCATYLSQYQKGDATHDQNNLQS